MVLGLELAPELESVLVQESGGEQAVVSALSNSSEYILSGRSADFEDPLPD